MGGGDLNLKKSWHPHTMKNQERVWKAEQAKQEEQRKLDDLRKEINEERDREELRRIGENSGVLAGNVGGEAKLEWMYKNSAELINREEYLLGRKIDKSFEQLQSEERRQEPSALGLKQSINHVEHECVPFSIREYRNLQSTEQVDMQRKTLEDPLMLIKQREMESRRKLLENPVRLKEIHRILKTEQEQATKRNKKSKKSKKSKKNKHKKGSSSSNNEDSDDSNDDLDRKLAKQMKKLKGESTNGDFKLDKLLDAKYRTLTKQLDMATTKPKQKKKSRKRSDSSENSEQRSEEEEREQTRERRGKHVPVEPRESRARHGQSNSNADERTKRREREQDVRRHHEASNSRRRRSRSRSLRRAQQKPQRRRSRSAEKQRPQRIRERSGERVRKHSRERSGERIRERSKERSRDRRRRSRTPEKQQQEHRRNPSPPAARQAAKSKLSDHEREARLREMMENATWREADRTKVVHKHREEYAREEAQNQARDFDKQFINKEVKKAIDNQTSIGNRIRSNLNNIQRTSAAMDSNFARK
ncbi:pre-mRNA-splicing factor CWC25 homolog [Drosophila grimshawi]|uniref:GH11166 n=1 Tax=Drosophila grimshawi TaxID=7222 RepID=B4JDD6_DROGR|nr:pre-mRNA-splicing factor CWC25 homolog [Drosophila grimshawi]EDW03306.1 GH11166 [Drosophila grimshawi]